MYFPFSSATINTETFLFQCLLQFINSSKYFFHYSMNFIIHTIINWRTWYLIFILILDELSMLTGDFLKRGGEGARWERWMKKKFFFFGEKLRKRYLEGCVGLREREHRVWLLPRDFCACTSSLQEKTELAMARVHDARVADWTLLNRRGKLKCELNLPERG